MDRNKSKETAANGDFERLIRDMNEELLISSVRLHELTERAEESEVLLLQSEKQLKDANADLTISISDLRRANKEVDDSNRAALNLMEDALISRQRTEELNAELLRGVAERKRITEELRLNQERLAAELAMTQTLQAASTRLILEDDVEALYDQILETAVTIMHSQFASLQAFHPDRGENGELELLGSRGFGPEAAKFWKWVRADSGCTCGEALRTGKRAVASNVETCEFMSGTKDRDVYLRADIRAAQTTPLVSRSGQLLGMISTHWREPHQPDEHDLRLFDILARQAADILERKQDEHRLRETEERFSKAFNASPLVLTITSLVDGRLLEVNETFCEVTGYSREEAIGRTTLELGLWSSSSDRDDELRTLAEDGQVRNREYKFRTRAGKEIIGTISAERIEIGGEPFALSVIQDITERKREETDRQFLFEITEIVRQTENAEDLLSAVATATGVHFGASRCLFNEIDLQNDRETVHRDYHKGLESVTGVHKISDYSPVTTGDMAAGRTVVNCDSKTDERTAADYEKAYKHSGERSYIAVPLLRNGQWVASLWLSDDKPRVWSPQDISLLETVAERTWLAVEKLKSESALRESEKQYRTLFDLVPVAVYTCDADGVIQAYNQNAVALWGREPEPGERFNGAFRTYFPDGRPMPFETGLVARILKGETLSDGEDEILVERPDGARKVAIAIPKLLRDERGNITGAINCLYDVTELKIAQRELIRAERRAANDYQELLQHIVPLGQKFGTARDLVTIYRAMHEFICYSMHCSAFFVSFYDDRTNLRTAAYAWGEGEEIDLGLLPPMLITPDGGSNSQAILNKKTIITNRYWDTMKDRPHVVLMENGIDPMSSLVVPMIIKDSVIGTLEVQAHHDRAFTTEHVVAMEMVANLAAVAIENVRLLEAHDKARQEAESANRTKDEFLSVLSHELRTPLNSMMGWIRMLRLGNLDADHTAKAIEVIDRNTRVQSSLIEDLLDVSRIISGKMRVEKELVDLVAAVKTATEGIRPIAAAKNIEFVVNASAEPLLADGDPVRLQQIVSNLVQNAIKFTTENGRIEVSITRSGGNAILEVSDTGIGIEKELQPYIFERFRQGDASTNRGFAGLGLGLTIVRTIVELHGGEIKVHSDGKDRGARFTIMLPLSEILYSENSNADQDDEQRLPAGELSGIKILLVDDDLDSLKSLQLFLEGQKADVAGAESAAEALKKLSEDRFDIMITDIGMPGVDGFELVAGIRSSDNGNDPNLPAIAVTAYASPGDRERAIAAGFQAHLAKPVNFDEVLSAVKRVLDPTKKALSAEH